MTKILYVLLLNCLLWNMYSAPGSSILPKFPFNESGRSILLSQQPKEKSIKKKENSKKPRKRSFWKILGGVFLALAVIGGMWITLAGVIWLFRKIKFLGFLASGLILIFSAFLAMFFSAYSMEGVQKNRKLTFLFRTFLFTMLVLALIGLSWLAFSALLQLAGVSYL